MEDDLLNELLDEPAHVVQDREHALALVKQFNLGRGRADLNHHTRIFDEDADFYYATSGVWNYIVHKDSGHVEVI